MTQSGESDGISPVRVKCLSTFFDRPEKSGNSGQILWRRYFQVEAGQSRPSSYHA